MKRILAGLLTVALMGLLIRSGLKAPAPGSTDRAPVDLASESPHPLAGAEVKVRALLLDASSGDVSAYLAAFGPSLRQRLGREVEEKGRSAFAGSLRAAAQARKSHAVFAPEADGPDAARVAVESVYPDRNERQTYRLERSEGSWAIVDVETVRAHRPQVKFGAPATFREPEGVPVPVEIPEGGEEAPRE